MTESILFALGIITLVMYGYFVCDTKYSILTRKNFVKMVDNVCEDLVNKIKESEKNWFEEDDIIEIIEQFRNDKIEQFDH